MNDYFYSRLYWGTHSKPRRAVNDLNIKPITSMLKSDNFDEILKKYVDASINGFVDL